MAHGKRRFTGVNEKMNKGTPEGTEEEISFVKSLNSNKDNSFWNVLIKNKDKSAVFLNALQMQISLPNNVVYTDLGKINDHNFKPVNNKYVNPKNNQKPTDFNSFLFSNFSINVLISNNPKLSANEA